MVNIESTRVELLGLTRDELTDFMLSCGEKPYRARQVYSAVYQRRVTGFDSITELPKTLRHILTEKAVVTQTRIERLFNAVDGTRRYLLKLADGQEVESVFMPDEYRDTICISSEVGCPLACDFCMTGVYGLKRNMTVGEILSQIVLVLNDVYGVGNRLPHGTNIVMMGMGEPFLNYANVMDAIRLLADPEGLNIVPRRITVSTAGIVPRIYDFAKEPIRPHLAISLTAANDALRNQLLPINRTYPLSELIEAWRG
jgi:23S rRNA (adenine2503-C2)-methyltransferase